jgi:hypothetical protein
VGHPTRSALTFEFAIGTVAVHARRLVAREQRAGAGQVEVRGLVTGLQSTVEVGSQRGRRSYIDPTDVGSVRYRTDELSWLI